MLTVNKKQLCEDEHIAAGFRLCEVIRDFGYDAYLVGGCVRDILFNKHVHDVDVATNMPMNELNNKFYCQSNNGEKHGTILVNIAGDWIETTQFRMDGNYSDGRHPDEVKFSQSFEEDTKRRDFTINAIGLDADGKIVDYQGGQKDLEDNLIRAVGNPEERFNEDALRILRAIRFAARFDFTIESTTSEAIKKCKDKLTLIARERIGDEIKKAASYGIYEFYRFIDMLIDYQLTDIIDSSHFVNWTRATRMLLRYLNECNLCNPMQLTDEEFVQQNLAFLLASSVCIEGAIKEFRYDNKLLDLCKFINKNQELGLLNSFNETNLYKLFLASKSKYFNIFLNYMYTSCLFELKTDELKKLDYVDTKLAEYHDYVAGIIENTLCLTGRAYGVALVDYEAWFCYKTFEGHEPTKMDIESHLLKWS